MKPIDVTRKMLNEFQDTPECKECLDNAEDQFFYDRDNIERAIADVSEDSDAAQDAVEALNSDAFGSENASMLLHGDPFAAQALVRKYFVRTNSARIVAQLEANFAAALERANEERLDAEAESRAVRSGRWAP